MSPIKKGVFPKMRSFILMAEAVFELLPQLLQKFREKEIKVGHVPTIANDFMA